MWIPVLLTALYSGWIIWQRRTPPEPPKAARPVDNPLGKFGSGVQIVQFYTGAAEIARGQQALICYGVVNATTVRLDPPVADVWPSMSRCLNVTPAQTTRYTLTAEGADHQAVSESIEIAVSGTRKRTPP